MKRRCEGAERYLLLQTRAPSIAVAFLVAGVALGSRLRAQEPECAGFIDLGGVLFQDPNGDGLLNVTDAVYLLQFLFTGGDSPLPLCEPDIRLQNCLDEKDALMDSLTRCLADLAAGCPNEKATRVPATGQAVCYDAANAEVGCNLEGDGQDGAIQAGCTRANRFTDNGDGTVTDGCTGLMWQQRTADASFDGAIDGSDRVIWQNAIGYCERIVLTTTGLWKLQANVMQGETVKYDDWRLPNVNELLSVLDWGRNPPIDTTFFPLDARGDWHWCSTTHLARPGSAWVVLLETVDDDPLSYSGKTTPRFFRAVRTACRPVAN
jgi:hypothetical protein